MKSKNFAKGGGGGFGNFQDSGGFRFCGHQDFSGGVETPCQAMTSHGIALKFGMSVP